MKPLQKLTAASVLAVGTALATAAIAQQQRIHLDDFVADILANVPADSEVIVSKSDSATPEDDELFMIMHHEFMDTVSTCDEEGQGIQANSVVMLSYPDLEELAIENGGQLDFDLGALVVAFREASEKRFFETAPDLENSEYSEFGGQADYFYTQMANDFEAATGVSLTTVTVVSPDPNMRCNVSMEEMLEGLPPEMREQLEGMRPSTPLEP